MTIKDIAELAGVSAGTVDRVIHNRGSVNPEKRRRIEEIIKHYDFKPNLYASNLKANKVCTVGYLTPLLDSEDGYWNLVYQGVLKAQADLADFPFKVETYEYDRNQIGSFSIQAERMYSAGVDACVIVTKCVDETRTFLGMHPDIPSVFIDSFVSDTSPLCVIGQNPYIGGAIAGKLLKMMCSGEGKYLTFSFLNSQISHERRKGFSDYLRNDGKVDVVEYDLDSVEEIPDIIVDAIDRCGRIDGVFSPCFAGHYFGRQKGLIPGFSDARIVTYDLLEANKAALLSGTIDCILSQRPVFQGYAGIYQISRYLLHKQAIEPFIEVQTDILFVENLPNDFDENATTKVNQYCIPLRG